LNTLYKKEQLMNTTVILVHGAFADGGGWGDVIPLLEKSGYNVIAVQNPLTSFADDVATTRRVIDAPRSSSSAGHSGAAGSGGGGGGSRGGGGGSGRGR
jgi:uncharacterized membrane protein YgcG